MNKHTGLEVTIEEVCNILPANITDNRGWDNYYEITLKSDQVFYLPISNKLVQKDYNGLKRGSKVLILKKGKKVKLIYGPLDKEHILNKESKWLT
ncbi:MAG: hypothetical protein PHD81_04000 [Candidatus Nanoarchaeia archaeon]|nr:hypothetical protein [Candidatus Nanoarchaeia archaeon]MDD5588244.1 hypothetical protein [Candidatus Nanoarchaeia archaeon]